MQRRDVPRSFRSWVKERALTEIGDETVALAGASSPLGGEPTLREPIGTLNSAPPHGPDPEQQPVGVVAGQRAVRAMVVDEGFKVNEESHSTHTQV